MPRTLKEKAEYAREWRARNAERINTANRARRADDPVHAERLRKRDRKRYVAYRKDQRYRKQYGLSLLDVQAEALLQRGRCLMCNGYYGLKLCVDHCHTEGHPRGLLCKACNTRIGWYENNKDKIAEYLARRIEVNS